MDLESGVALHCGICGMAPSLGPCAVCGEEVCEAHAGPGAEGRVVCRPCSYKDTLGDVGRHVEERERAAAEVKPATEGGVGPTRKIIGLIVLVSVAAGIVTFYLPIAKDAIREEAAYCIGPGGEEEPGLADSVRGLWRLRGAMDFYLHRSKGKPPRSLSALEGSDLTDCPGCGKPWRFELVGETGYLVACPEPHNHERMAVFLSHKYGPPQVRLFSEAGVR